MINTETTQVTYLTRADQTVRYSIPFVYNKNELTDAPELTVTLNGGELVFGADYTVNESGLQLVSAVEEGLELVITRTSVFEQLRDFQTGLIDPEQIEGGFDDSVMRDQELKRGLSDLSDALDGKQDIIPDLDTIRSGSAAGATALQPTDLATVATTGSYNDLLDRPTIPSVGAGVITITQGGVTKGSFNVNQNGNTTIEVDEGGGSGGGAVDSVNGKVGVVVLDSSDVGALPNTTKYAASLVLSVNPTTFVVTAQLKDQNNNNIGVAQTIDLPLESVVVSGAYDSATREVVLTLEGGSTIRFSVADLVSGLQTEITSVNMLSADLVDDSNSAHKFVTAADKTTWSGKQDYISDLSTIRAGASAGATAVQPGNLATVATSGSYNDLANKPTIPAAQVNSDWNANSGVAQILNKPTLGTAAAADTGDFATAAQGALADTAVQPADLAAVATSGSYTDLSNTPTIPMVGAGTITITQGGVTKGSFDVNQSGNTTIDVDAGGGSSSYTAGTGIDITNNAISVQNPVAVSSLGSVAAVPGVNSSNLYSIGSVHIGNRADTSSSGSVSIGQDASGGDSGVAVGSNASASFGGISLGWNSSGPGGKFHIALSESDPDTYAIVTHQYDLVNIDGTIPEARLADTTNAAQGQVLTLDSNLNAVWQAGGGGGSSYTAGTGIDITNDVISVTAPTLVNLASVNTSLNIGSTTSTDRTLATSVGINAVCNNSGVAIGYGSRTTNFNGGIAIGVNASSEAEGAIQLGRGFNITSNTLKVGLGSNNVELLSADGTIPADSLIHAINKYSTMPTAGASNEGWIVQFTGATDSTYTHGYIYECKAQGTNPETYAWEAVEVQAGGGSSLPDQTGQSGKFLTTDGTDASWSDKPLVNTATGSDSVSILSTTSGQNSVVIGHNVNAGRNSVSIGSTQTPSQNNGAYSIAIGQSVSTTGSSAISPRIAIGNNVTSSATRAIQIGFNGTNSDANTFKVANANGNFEIMSADGTVPADRLASTTGLADGNYRLRLVMASGVPTLEWVAE